MRVRMLGVVSGWGNSWVGCVQVGVVECGGVARRCLDAEAEQVTDPSDVAAGGVDLLEDAVLAQGLRAEAGSSPWELLADWGQARRADAADEQVGVDRV